MLGGLTLITLMVSPPTVTTEVRPLEVRGLASLLSLVRTRLTLDAFATPEGVGLTSTFWSKSRRGSLGLGLDIPSLTAPDPGLGTRPGQGFLAARIGHGLYFGHAPLPKADILSERELRALKPTLGLPDRANAWIDGSLFFTPELGVRVDVGLGSSMYAGLSFIYRPRW